MKSPEPGFYQISNEKALEKGLRFTDFGETVRTSFDSVQKKRYIPEPESEAIFGISNERESEIISAWKNKN